MLTIEIDIHLDDTARTRLWNDTVATVPRVGEKIVCGVGSAEYTVTSVTHLLRYDEAENVQRVEVLVHN